MHLNQYKIYCTTETLYVDTDYIEGETPPTTCPNNNGHTIDTEETTLIGQYEENEVTIREEQIPTGGHWQACDIEVVMDTTDVWHIQTHSWPFPVNLLSAKYQTDGSALHNTYSSYSHVYFLLMSQI